MSDTIEPAIPAGEGDDLQPQQPQQPATPSIEDNNEAVPEVQEPQVHIYEDVNAPPHEVHHDTPMPTNGGVIVRYGLMKNVGLFAHDWESPLAPGTKVVVRTERGVELGEVMISACKEKGGRCISVEQLDEYVRSNGPEYPFSRRGKALRLANPQDVIDHQHLVNSAKEEATYCRQQIRELQLDMRLITVEHLLGGERIIFYFASESRVDFRELVRRIASQYRTRIEMRQVGARDEARLVADYERCGRQCCCKEYLKDLKPVSMRMAKTQKATLDPSKISGRCGRLMCCLRYEDTCYEELRKTLPRKNTYVRTANVAGKVVDSQILTQLVRLELPNRTLVVVGVDEIIQRDLPAPAFPAPPAETPVREPAPAIEVHEEATDAVELPEEEVVLADDTAESPQDQPVPAETGNREGGSSQLSRRRRRRRGKRSGQGPQQPQASGRSSQYPQGSQPQQRQPQPQAGPDSQGQPQASPQGGQPGGGGRHKRRHRRRGRH